MEITGDGTTRVTVVGERTALQRALTAASEIVAVRLEKTGEYRPEGRDLASLTSKVPLAAFDRDRLGEELRLRFAETGEPFRGIGMDDPTTLAGGELVIDDGNSLIALYPYRNSADTKLTPDSTDAFVLVCGAPGVSDSILDGASETAEENVRQFCGGDVSDLS